MLYLLRGFPLSTFKTVFASVLLMAASLLWVMPVQAMSAPDWRVQGESWLAAVDGSTAARIVERRTGGKVLSVNRQEKKGRVVYRVKVLLPEGRVRTMTVDGETGGIQG